jgi:hypothetical protein
MFKSKLNEWCQKNKLKLPVYKVENPNGPAHQCIYHKCTIEIGEIYSIEIEYNCSSKKEIENKASEIVFEKLINLRSIKDSLNSSFKNERVFLVDFDNSADISIDSLNGEVVIFVSSTFNLNSKKMKLIKERNNIKIIQALHPLPEIVDHMMTWFACKNIEKLKEKNVVIFSKDSGLNALVHILKDEGVQVNFNTIN